MTVGRRVWSFATALVGLLILDAVLTAAYLGASFIVLPDADDGQAIAVLWGDLNEIGPETERRIVHAIQIWKDGGRAQFIFCVGGSRPSRGYLGAHICAERLVTAGVPVDRIRVGRGSNDTVSNLSEVAEIASSLAVQRVVVVASPLQSMRGKIFLAPPDGLTINWSPYDLRTTIDPVALWWEVHHEWLALTSMLLPPAARRFLINVYRPSA